MRPLYIPLTHGRYLGSVYIPCRVYKPHRDLMNDRTSSDVLSDVLFHTSSTPSPILCYVVSTQSNHLYDVREPNKNYNTNIFPQCDQACRIYHTPAYYKMPRDGPAYRIYHKPNTHLTSVRRGRTFHNVGAYCKLPTNGQVYRRFCTLRAYIPFRCGRAYHNECIQPP